MGNSAAIWNAGDRYYRTDLALEFYWDGTRWVTTTLYQYAMGVGDVAQNTTTAGTYGRWTPPSALDMYVTTVALATYVNSTNDGTKYWSFDVRKLTSAVASTSLGTANTSADSAGAIYLHTVTVNAVVVVATYLWIDLNVAKTSTPGNLRVVATMNYRLVST